MIICLIGKQRAGKDTTADYLVAKYGFTKVSLAGKVKEIARDLFGMEEKQRGLLIDIGMKMREIDPDVWVKYVIRTIREQGLKDVVIPDVRFLNEVDHFQRLNAVFARVSATYPVRSKREGYTPEYEFDRSEIELDGLIPDYTIPNNSTLAALYWRIDDMMADLGRGIR